jgi:hypothetical protein
MSVTWLCLGQQELGSGALGGCCEGKDPSHHHCECGMLMTGSMDNDFQPYLHFFPTWPLKKHHLWLMSQPQGA